MLPISPAHRHIGRIGETFRPHIKTHRIAAVARQQLAAGRAKSIARRSARQRYLPIRALINYNILGAAKQNRLRKVNERVTRLAVVANSETTVKEVATAFEDRKPLAMPVKCDTGGRRGCRGRKRSCRADHPEYLGQVIGINIAADATPNQMAKLLVYRPINQERLAKICYVHCRVRK